MRAVRGLVEACHAGPTALVTAFAVAVGAASGLGLRLTLLVGLAVLSGQLTVGWSNDWYDASADLRAGRAEKPVVRGLVAARTVGIGALLAGLACVPLSLSLGGRAGVVHLLAVASALSYDLALKPTALSWLPFALSFGLLPGVVSRALPGHPWPSGAVVVVSALVGVAAHFTNGVKDMQADALTGVRGLPQRLGVRRATALSAGCVAAAGAVLVVARPGWAALPLAALAVALAGAAVRISHQGEASRLFALSMAAAAPLVVALVLTGGV